MEKYHKTFLIIFIVLLPILRFFSQGAEKSLKAALYAKDANRIAAVHDLTSIARGICILLFLLSFIHCLTLYHKRVPTILWLLAIP